MNHFKSSNWNTLPSNDYKFTFSTPKITNKPKCHLFSIFQMSPSEGNSKQLKASMKILYTIPTKRCDLVKMLIVLQTYPCLFSTLINLI